MSDRKTLSGKFVWFELVTSDVKKAQAFYRDVFGWKTQPFPMGSASYDMILTGDSPDTMIGGYVAKKNQPSRWISYVSVEDVDAVAKSAAANGGKVIETPSDIPDVGRTAAISDPQGAELHLLRNAQGDKPDAKVVGPGQILWNELQTTEPKKALAFYEKVLGFAHSAMENAKVGTYFIISKGGVDRGGVTSNLLPGARPFWLPYVHVDDPDAVVARARKAGAKAPMPPEDVPDAGRIGVIEDPVGALLAVMKPMPAETMREKAELQRV